MSGTAPAVIVVALVGGATLAGCLGRLAGQLVRPSVLLPAGEDAASWRQRQPGLVFREDDGAPVPHRRLAAVAEADAEVVALVEDTTWPGPGWHAAIERAFADPALGALGGPITVAATLPARLRALGWTEYGAFTSHVAGPVAVVPGNNMAFRRAPLLAFLDAGEGLIEAVACRRLRAAGLGVRTVPGMAATYAGPAPAQARLVTRFQHGRLYGSGSGRERSLAGRLLLAGRWPLLPPLMTARTCRELWRAGAATDWRAGTWVAALHAAWAAGEMVGLLAGPGRSLEAWR